MNRMKYLISIVLFFDFCLLSFVSAQNREISFKTYTINNGFCKGIQTHFGSLLFIPDNAFINEKGETCTKTVTIKYREFHSQLDMFYSGLNMIWQEGSRRYILESVGMFEIEAWCGEQKLKLKENKLIQVRMKTRRDLKGLSSFIYDRQKNSWSKYNSPVVDFSFFDKRNNADSVSFWGSGRVSAASATVDVETSGGIYNPVTYFNKFPEGFFKGMNIKEMGIFNYDGVIKDSLAIPMQPEMLVRESKTMIDQKIYVTYPNRNTLVYYNPEDLKENFVLLNVKGIRMFTEFKDGSFAATKEEELNLMVLETYRKQKVSFLFDKLPAKPKNEKELLGITGLKAE
ncbi:MAG TPA: hypothetical protein PLU73_03890 [Bacteroidia bacterium]|nr:hypothetical protein [Bacteroidia bacterium]